jgi:predicted regulator of Ras-like GTPase activity (Roadblock/LC7/MglB family)
LRCGLILYLSQNQAIDKVLSNLIGMILAQYILLTDTSGQTISISGQLDQADPVAFGALVASDMATSQEMARLTGKNQNYNMILRESSGINIWIVNAGAHLVLMFAVSPDVPLGWMRLMIRRGAKSIADIADDPTAEGPNWASRPICWWEKPAQPSTKITYKAVSTGKVLAEGRRHRGK